MGRKQRAGGCYIQPIKSTDGSTPAEGPPGTFTLAASTTYYYILGGADAPYVSVQLTGIDAGLIITTATIQDCNHGKNEVTDIDSTAGKWINEDPPSPAYVAIDGTGWAAGATPSVVTATGGNVGGAMFHISDTAAARTRLEVVVGLTGGKAMVSGFGKD